MAAIFGPMSYRRVSKRGNLPDFSSPASPACAICPFVEGTARMGTRLVRPRWQTPFLFGREGLKPSNLEEISNDPKLSPTSRTVFEFSYVGNGRRPSQKSGTRRENSSRFVSDHPRRSEVSTIHTSAKSGTVGKSREERLPSFCCHGDSNKPFSLENGGTAERAS